MTPENKRTFNTAVGSLFMGVGIIAWAVAVYFAVTPADKKRLPPVSLAPSVEVSSCRTAVATLYGFQSRIQGEDLVLSSSDIADPRHVLESATAAMSLCKRELKEFCMGTGCTEQGVSFTLVKPDNQRRVTAGAAPVGAAAALSSKGPVKPPVN